MDMIIANNISNIAINTKMVLLTTNSGEIIFDISKAFKGNDIFINITKVTNYYKKEFSKWVRLKSTQNFIRAMEKETPPDVGGLKKGDEIGKIEAFTSLLIKRKAGRYGGTYIHENILLDYLMWLDIDLKVQVHLFLKQLLKQITVVKISRVETKAKFRPLTDAIRDIFIPAQTNPTLQKYGYQYIMNLINLRVLGVTAKQFREINGLDPKVDIHTRDYLSQKELDNIVRFQQHLHSFIIAGITDYNSLRTLINNTPLQ